MRTLIRRPALQQRCYLYVLNAVEHFAVATDVASVVVA